MRIQQKPIIHGRDHRPGGVDPIPGIGGLAFDTYPQAGNWLYAETDDETGAGGSPSGFGIELDDFSAGGVFVGALGGGELHLKTQSGGDIFLQSSDDINLTASDEVRIIASGSLAFMAGKGARVQNTDGGEAAVLGSHTGLDLHIRVEDDQVVIYKDGDADTIGNPLLVIDATGTPSYHILSGATWVADL